MTGTLFLDSVWIWLFKFAILGSCWVKNIIDRKDKMLVVIAFSQFICNYVQKKLAKDILETVYQVRQDNLNSFKNCKRVPDLTSEFLVFLFATENTLFFGYFGPS